MRGHEEATIDLMNSEAKLVQEIAYLKIHIGRIERETRADGSMADLTVNRELRCILGMSDRPGRRRAQKRT